MKWLFIGLVGTFGLLYGVLFIIVRRANKIIKRQYSDLHHEVSERLTAEQKLRQGFQDPNTPTRRKASSWPI